MMLTNKRFENDFLVKKIKVKKQKTDFKNVVRTQPDARQIKIEKPITESVERTSGNVMHVN